jgi:hypothetical protein
VKNKGGQQPATPCPSAAHVKSVWHSDADMSHHLTKVELVMQFAEKSLSQLTTPLSKRGAGDAHSKTYSTLPMRQFSTSVAIEMSTPVKKFLLRLNSADGLCAAITGMEGMIPRN